MCGPNFINGHNFSSLKDNTELEDCVSKVKWALDTVPVDILCRVDFSKGGGMLVHSYGSHFR